MAADLPPEEFGLPAPGNHEGAGERLPPPEDSHAEVKYSGQMNDDSRTPPEGEDDFPLPDWLKESISRPEDLLADEESTPGEGWQPLPKPAAVAVGVPRRRYIFRSTETTRVSPRVSRCRVTILSAAGEFDGEAEGPDIPGVRPEVASRAALDALNKAEGGRVALALKGARVLRVFEVPLVVVGVYGLNTGETIPLVGACLVHNSVEQAAILATLQAADRWLAWQARKSARR
jgi:hypothetical protein